MMTENNTFPPTPLKHIAEEVAALLRQNHQTVSVAETAAGGLISAALLSTSGASKVYKGGLTLYTLQSRIEFAGWVSLNLASRLVIRGAIHVQDMPSTSHSSMALPFRDVKLTERPRQTSLDVDKYNGPTPEIVAGLAENVRRRLESTYCVCESGTAGPTGGSTPNRTPGYVALAIASEAATVTREVNTDHGPDRQANMLEFACKALSLLKEVIQDRDSGSKLA